MLRRYTDIVIQHHKWVILLTLIFVFGLGAGMKNLTTTSDFRIYFSEDNPQLIAFEDLEKHTVNRTLYSFMFSPKIRIFLQTKTLI